MKGTGQTQQRTRTSLTREYLEEGVMTGVDVFLDAQNTMLEMQAPIEVVVMYAVT